MSTLMQIIVCVLCYLSLEVHASTAINFTRQWVSNEHPYEPSVVNVNNTLLSIGFLQDIVIINPIDSSNSNSNMRSRRVSLPPGRILFKTLNGIMPIRENILMNAVSLGNGKIIVIVSAIVVDSDDRSEIYFILDKLCTSIKYFEIRHGQDRRIVHLLPYYDTFDLFYTTRLNNGLSILDEPQRYNDQGEQIKLNYNFALETELNFFEVVNFQRNDQLDAFRIQTIKPNDPSEGYVCTTKTNGTILVKLVDSKFQVVKESAQEYLNINTMSSNNGNVSLCYLNQTLGYFCHFLDAELKTRTKVHIIDPRDRIDTKLLMIINTPDGGAILVHTNKRRMTFPPSLPSAYPGMATEDFYIRRINPDGSTYEPVDLGVRGVTHVNRFYKTQGFQMENEEFCLVTTLNTKIFVDCINL